MTSEPEKQTTAIHILSDISSSKSLKEMKFGQLIKYKIETHVSWKIMNKMWWRTIPRIFSKKSKLRISLTQESKSLVCFRCMPSQRAINI